MSVNRYFVLLLRSGGWGLRPSIVSALGPHGHLAMSLNFIFHPDLPETSARSRIRRLIPNGVLIADVVRHLLADLIHFIQSLGKKRQSAGPLRNDLERAPGTFGMFLIAKYSDRIYRWAVFLLQLLYRLFQSFL